ncbi:MAG: acyltransferase [Planctomycetota bacterium]
MYGRSGARETDDRLPQLDGLRGLAILLVMLHHFATFRPSSTVETTIKAVTDSLWIGVDLFFILSGYLITGILLASRQRPRYFSSFFARRFLRIFPLYYAVIFFALIVLPHLPQAGEIDTSATDGRGWWYWAYLQNYLMANLGNLNHLVTAVTWSLAVEEQFYLVWPFVVWFTPAHRLTKICGGMIVGALLLRVGLALNGGDPIASYILTPTRMDTLAFGALAACLERGHGVSPRTRTWVSRVGIVALVGVLGMAAFGQGLKWEEWSVHTIGFTLLGAVFFALLITVRYAAPSSWRYQWFSHPALRSLGRYSYAIYLFHVPVTAVVRESVLRLPKDAPAEGTRLHLILLLIVSSGVATYAAAWLSWHLYEKHFLKLKSRFPRVGSETETVPAVRMSPEISSGPDATSPTRPPQA